MGIDDPKSKWYHRDMNDMLSENRIAIAIAIALLAIGFIVDSKVARNRAQESVSAE